MDGVNPTLAFAVLLFGLSGNARDATNSPPIESELDGGSGCPALMIETEVPEPASREILAETFWNGVAEAPDIPVVRDPTWADPAFPGMDGATPTGDSALATGASGSDPLRRRNVPAGAGGMVGNPDGEPCGPVR